MAKLSVSYPAQYRDFQLDRASIDTGKLFNREVVYRPVKNFRDVAAALMKPAKAERVIDLRTLRIPDASYH
jgi:hypothetical protein